MGSNQQIKYTIMEDFEELRNKYGNKNPYKVPENYFEELPDKLMARIADQDQAPVQPTKHLFFNRFKPLLHVAAVVAIICAATYIFIQPNVKKAQNQWQSIADNISADEMDDLCDDLDDDDIYELL